MDERLLARLQSRGLHLAGGLGYDFTNLRTNDSTILRDAEVLSFLRKRLFATTAPPSRWAVPYIYWALDQSARAHQVTAGAAPRLLVPLQRDGFVSVGDWGLGAAHLRALRQQVEEALAAKGGPVRSRGDDAELPALRPLLRNATLERALRGYLGGPVRYDGHTVLRLTNELTSVSQYMSAEWHHDRCGRRLKLFVFLHDVDDETRPTLVLRGSHNLIYSAYDLESSRGQAVDAWATRPHAHADVVRLTGPAGGGFLLDTNALHRGEHRGTRPRTVVLLHFHAHGKIERLASLEHAGLLDPSLHLPFHAKPSIPPWALYPNEPPLTYAKPPSAGHGSDALGLAVADRRRGGVAVGEPGVNECSEVDSALHAQRPAVRRLGRLHCERLGELCGGAACY